MRTLFKFVMLRINKRLGFFMLKFGKVESAARFFCRCRCHEGLVLCAKREEEAQSYVRAIEFYQKAVVFDESTCDDISRFARCMIELGQFDLALIACATTEDRPLLTMLAEESSKNERHDVSLQAGRYLFRLAHKQHNRATHDSSMPTKHPPC